MTHHLSYADIENLLFQFELREKDFKNLKQLADVLLPYRDEFADAFVNQVMKFPDSQEFISDTKDFKDKIKHWFERLFSGKYDSEYLTYILRVAKVHAEEGIPPSYITVMIDFVQRFCTKRIVQYVGKLVKERHISHDEAAGLVEGYIRSLSKLLHMNLDVMVSFYVDYELRTFIEADPLEKKVIKFTKRFAFSMEVVILAGLMVLGLVVVGLFSFDVTHFFHGDLSHGLISALGDLLILWTILELLNSEIKFMMGGELAVSAFVSVALAATIREALVMSLEHGQPVMMKLGIGILILILGIVYGIVKWFELKRKD